MVKFLPHCTSAQASAPVALLREPEQLKGHPGPRPCAPEPKI